MSFHRLLEQEDKQRQQQLYSQSALSDEMAFFSTSHFRSAPSVPLQKQTLDAIRPRDDVDDFLSSDLELSFASTMSLYSPTQDSVALAPEGGSTDRMDVSPAPISKAFSHNDNGKVVKPSSRPRAFTSAARMFGHDVSNSAIPNLLVHVDSEAGVLSTNEKILQRSAQPSEWFVGSYPSSNQSIKSENYLAHLPPSHTNLHYGEDAMDVDSFVELCAPNEQPQSPAVPSAAPTVTAFDSLFHDSMSPRRSLDSPRGPQPKKRRSSSPKPTYHDDHDLLSSPALDSSPSERKLERISSGPLLSRISKPSLAGLGNPTLNALKRPRRPALSAMAAPSVAGAVQSAYPILSSPGSSEQEYTTIPQPRRAFSALIPSKGVVCEPPSDDSSFDGPDMSSPAQAYSKRQHVKTIRRCDGTDDFRPLTGATNMRSMYIQESPSAKFMGSGMPGFGDNEAHGKILPCHRVTEDGLMRINATTLNNLLCGAYNSRITEFHVIDCRFDYEYDGGHIPGAINISTPSAAEDFLLGSCVAKPRPSVSGDISKKTVLVFHCEFSAKRAPTIAKHLRAKDRAMNNHVYPRIHFPELYILEGGYCQYFKISAARCQPSAYVRMDDPTHAISRREDLDQLRKAKFGRHKSYAYGEGPFKGTSSSQQQTKRNTAPQSGANPVFTAASAARNRRGGLASLVEDGNTTSHSGDEDDTDLGDSPCPPPVKASMVKGKRLGRAPLARAETFGPSRMNY